MRRNDVGCVDLTGLNGSEIIYDDSDTSDSTNGAGEEY